MTRSIGPSTAEAILNTMRSHLENQFSLPREQIESMLPSFVATLKNHMSNLESLLAEGDLLKLGKAGHTIKGAFLNLGLEDCAEIAWEIEQQGKAGNPDTDFQGLVSKLSKRVGPLFQ